MNKIVTKIIFSILLLLVTGCGYKIIDNSQNSNFEVKEINTIGDQRVNFKIKNYILTNSKKGNKYILMISLDTKKIKKIKEKNKKNQTTKYEVSLTSAVEINYINKNKFFKNNITVSGDYMVGSSHSSTLNSEKRLLDDLIEKLSENIFKQINININDL